MIVAMSDFAPILSGRISFMMQSDSAFSVRLHLLRDIITIIIILETLRLETIVV